MYTQAAFSVVVAKRTTIIMHQQPLLLLLLEERLILGLSTSITMTDEDELAMLALLLK